MSEYIIRNMNFGEVKSIAIEWAGEEGWNPGKTDSTPFFYTDAKGFFVGLLDDEPVSCISAVAYEDDFGFLGFYIVKPEQRGKGYGIKIWNKALERLGSRNIGLDGVPSEQSNYMKSGFKLSHRNVRYAGIAKRIPEKITGVVSYSPDMFDDLVRYDAKCFPVERRRFLELWLQQPQAITYVSEKHGKINGYATLRKCGVGHKIGPLFANDMEAARTIFFSINKFLAEGSIIFLDTPETNKSAIELAECHGMQPVFETARMYNKEKPDIDIDRVFGITSFELG